MFKNLISSAANKYVVTLPDGEVKSIVLVDNCHGGRNMQEVWKLLKQLGCDIKPDKSVGDFGQGFIDESGWYHNRSESYKIAKSSGQPFNDQYTLPDNKLDSSCIRHFPEDTILSDMCSQPIYCCMRYEMMGECDCENQGVVWYTQNGELWLRTLL